MAEITVPRIWGERSDIPRSKGRPHISEIRTCRLRSESRPPFPFFRPSFPPSRLIPCGNSRIRELSGLGPASPCSQFLSGTVWVGNMIVKWWKNNDKGTEVCERLLWVLRTGLNCSEICYCLKLRHRNWLVRTRQLSGFVLQLSFHDMFINSRNTKNVSRKKSESMI
jgi:hypothetical protein